MSGLPPPSRPPWETQGQPLYTPDDAWYGRQGARVVIKPHPSRGDNGESRRRVSRGAALFGAVAGLAACVGIAAVVVQLTTSTGGGVPATAAPLVASSPAPAPTSSPSAGAEGAATTAYTLSAPATAGPYTLTTPASPGVQAVGSAGAATLMAAVKAAGGVPSSEVTGEYFIGGDQALGYAGYNGTFSPSAVLGAFGLGAKGVTDEAAGPHGGQMACGEVTASHGSTAHGTACVWATTTTIGMVEFFGNGVLEPVAHPKADSDVLKFRAAVEALKGGASPAGTATAAGTPTRTGTVSPAGSATRTGSATPSA
jgi:hypothetical protein